MDIIYEEIYKEILLIPSIIIVGIVCGITSINIFMLIESYPLRVVKKIFIVGMSMGIGLSSYNSMPLIWIIMMIMMSINSYININ